MAINPVLKGQITEKQRLLAQMRKRINERKYGNANGSGVVDSMKSLALGAPHVRRGENVMTSRGYSFARVAARLANLIDDDDCKVEMGVSEHLAKAMNSCKGWSNVQATKRFLCPLDPGLLLGGTSQGTIIDNDFGRELSQKMWAGVAQNFDRDEAEWLSRRHGVRDSSKDWIPESQKVSNQSWMTQSLGGAVIPFPEMGPLIPLLRNKNALMTAGAQVFPLPPQGRIAFPRQTAPTLGYHVGEGVKITQSAVNTDQFTLSAKKIGAFIVANNELIRYGGPVVEQMFRNDMTITLGLTLDYDLLQAEGSDNVSAGLIGYPGVATVTPTTAASGNTLAKLAPQDIYKFISTVQANNATFEGWICRPELFWAMVQARASVLTTNDQYGLFVFDVIRKLQEGDFDRIAGYKAVTTANAPLNRVQGSTSNGTTLYGGMWSDYKIGIYGTIEIATADQGDSLFPQDQTMFRAILSADGGPQHPGAFVYCDTLNSTTVGP